MTLSSMSPKLAYEAAVNKDILYLSLLSSWDQTCRLVQLVMPFTLAFSFAS